MLVSQSALIGSQSVLIGRQDRQTDMMISGQNRTAEGSQSLYEGG